MQIEQARDLNQNIRENKIQFSKSMIMDNLQGNGDGYRYKENFQEGVKEYECQRMQQKDQKNRIYEEVQRINNYKRHQQNQNRMQAKELQRRKFEEDQEIQRKRQENLQKWKSQFLEEHNKEAFKVWEDEERNKRHQQDALENYIVNQGARQLHERVARQKKQVLQRESSMKDEYIHTLQKQLEHDEYRSANDKLNEKMKEKQMIDNRNRFMRERDGLLNQENKVNHLKHLEVLKGQFKERNLKQDEDPIEYAGIGSPVHIGKYMGDDRRRQIQWLEKNLYKDLST